ncbi:MAG: TerB family tellurite resistance protein [Anderseniella sp.]
MTLIAAIVVIALAALGLAGVRNYLRHRRNASVLPDPASLQPVEPGMLDKQRAALASNLLNDASKLAAHEIEVTHHALWMAMLLEAAPDGSIDPRKIRAVADLFGQMTGNKLDYGPVIESAELVQSDRKSALAEISKASGVSSASKEHILAGALLVSVSDRTLEESEAELLGDIADALAINQHERQAIYDGITRRLSS